VQCYCAENLQLPSDAVALAPLRLKPRSHKYIISETHHSLATLIATYALSSQSCGAGPRRPTTTDKWLKRQRNIKQSITTCVTSSRRKNIQRVRTTMGFIRRTPTQALVPP